MNKFDQSPPTHLVGVLRTLWRWRRPILLTTLAGAIVSIVVSLLLPVYFAGYTSFVAISPEQISIEGTFGTTNRVQFYGTGDDIDRLLSIAESQEVVDYMVQTFDLYTVYEIDSNTAKAPVRVREEFRGLYEIERSPRDVIELTVEDSNPERAATMARAARERIGQVSLALILATHRRNAEGLRRDVAESERRIGELNRRLSELRSASGVFNTEAQSEALSTASGTLDQRLAIAEARLEEFNRIGRRDSIAKLSIDLTGLRRNRELLDEQLDRLNANIGLIEGLEEERRLASLELGDNRARLKQYESILNGDQRTLEVIEEARVPVQKSRPVRWLIVIVATVLTFVVAVLGALLLDSGRRYDWHSITR